MQHTDSNFYCTMYARQFSKIYVSMNYKISWRTSNGKQNIVRCYGAKCQLDISVFAKKVL